MTDLLKDGAAWLETQRHAFAASPITYRRGALSVALSATVGRTVFEVDGGNGMVEHYEARDYLVRAQDLVLGGVVTLPERGDVLEEVAGAKTFTYEVMVPKTLSSGGVGQLEPHWRYSDPHRQTLRIHTKLVES